MIAVNDEQYERMADKVVRMAGGSVEGKTVAVWGLTFKARTDDLRRLAVARGHRATPSAGRSHQGLRPRRARRRPPPTWSAVADPYAACEGADVLAVLTEWDEFRWLDFDKVAGLMVHARDRRRPQPARSGRRPRASGFVYDGLGRP